MSESISYVGLDVHKAFIQVAVVRKGEADPVEWRTPNTPAKVDALVRKLKKVSGGRAVLCYEAGPTGYVLSRRLNREEGLRCLVVAPSLIPTKPGERIKTDRRDAKKLAGLLKAGLLTEVQPPTPDDEARRELWRARCAAKDDEKRAKQRLSNLLLRHGRTFTAGKKAFTKMHMEWLEKQKFESQHLQAAFDALLRALTQASDRRREIDEALEATSAEEAVRQPVALLKCFKGMKTTSAIGVVTELYSFERFRSPRSLMAFLGATASEHSTGGKPNRGRITKAGNTRLRKLFVQIAWNYTRSNKAGRQVRKRREGQPGWAIDVAEQAQHRLHRRYWMLVGRGKHPNKALMAVARELAGFIWVVLAKHAAERREAHA